MEKEITATVMGAVRKAQVDEDLGAKVYAFMAAREKNEDNKRVLTQMSNDERLHERAWHEVTGEDLNASGLKVLWLKLLTIVLGFTFVVKSMEKGEEMAVASYSGLQKELPQAADMLADERRHEGELYAMLDEERLHYVGAMVLGLNDALVELTGAIAGVTFALQDTQLIALTGIVTGVSATLSMAASNYLAERAEGHDDAVKSSVITGIAYLVTVVLLVLPYLLLPSGDYLQAFIIMIIIVLAIIAFFNFYISVAKDEPFGSRFLEMAAISLGVAAISYGIGIAAKVLLGIDVG